MEWTKVIAIWGQLNLWDFQNYEIGKTSMQPVDSKEDMDSRVRILNS